MPPGREQLPAVDPLTPSASRVYAILIGDDRWAFPADLRAAEQLLSAEPLAAVRAREGRQFLGRAAAWIAAQGVRQWIDLGAGLPVASFPAIHEVVHQAMPDAQVVYVDNDPVAFEGLASTVAGTEGVTPLLGDLRDPGQVLRAAQSAGLDLSAPVCLLFGLVLHFMPVSDARAVVTRYISQLAPGSYIVISVGRADGEHGERLVNAYRPGATSNPARDEVTAWMAGMDLVPPGMTDVRDWVPGRPGSQNPPQASEIWGGVGVVPGAEPAGDVDRDARPFQGRGCSADQDLRRSKY